jgi:hypothetical protein
VATLSQDVVIGQLLSVLVEALDGPGQWAYFADDGLTGTLITISAADASRPVAGSSIAAHVHHVVFALAASAAWIRGDRSPHHWNKSWEVRTVDDAAWTRLREQLRVRCEELRQAIEAHAGDNLEAMGGAIGAIAHTAYHLGAIRQKAAYIRQG